jgi:hypothetical protein
MISVLFEKKGFKTVYESRTYRKTTRERIVMKREKNMCVEK